MYEPLLIYALLIALVLYVGVPLSGAFTIRRKWRVFRRQVVEASISKEVTYSEPSRSAEGIAGRFSFTGGLQAIQEDNTIWLSNGKVSVRAELEGIRLYLLPTSRSIETEGRVEMNKAMLPQDMPKRIKWEQVYSLNQGTGVVLSGQVYIDNGTPVFRDSEDYPLLVIIYDGDKESILRRSVWSGRQLNEYWNNLTPMSLIAGSFSMFVMTFFSYRNYSTDMTSILLLLLSIIPFIPFFPPGIGFYFLFRRFWRSARYLRGERDLLRLPARFSGYEEYPSCAEALERNPDCKLRSCGIIKEADVMSISCRLYRPGNISEAKLPDHFYEELVVPGDPEELAWKCRSRARGLEILAAASASIGFIINALVLYFGLMWLL